MLQWKIGRHLLIAFVLINVLLIGAFAYGLYQQPDMVRSLLPGEFAPALSPDLSGNMLFLAILLAVNAALFLLFGIGGTWHALWSGLGASPKKLRGFLGGLGLADDISGVVAEAAQEEEKRELSYVERAGWILRVGIVLAVISLPLTAIAYTHADPAGPALFTSEGKAIANGTMPGEAVWQFTGDQLAGALLLDAPEIFHWRLTGVETDSTNVAMAVLVLLYRTLIGLGVLLAFIGWRRAATLRAYALEVAMPAADIVASNPELQNGHGHHEDHAHEDHGHSDHGHHDEHGHSDHGHEDHAHDDHGHAHGHEEPAHAEHGHENHGHEGHGHEGHGHESHGHDDQDGDGHDHGDHGHEDDHGHGHDAHGHADSVASENSSSEHGDSAHDHDDHGHGEHGHGEHGHDDHGHHGAHEKEHA